MNIEERETIVRMSDADDTVYIWTAQRTQITRMRNSDAFTEVSSRIYDGQECVEFTIPRDRYNVNSGAKRTYKISEEERALRAERLRRAREAS